MLVFILFVSLSMANLSYSAQSSNADPHALPLLENRTSQVFHGAELVDFVLSIIVYGALLHYFLRSTRKVLLYYLISATPRAAAQLLDVVEAPLKTLNETGAYSQGIGEQDHVFSIQGLKTWAFIIFLMVVGMGFLVGLTNRSGVLVVSVAGITTFPPLYSQLSENLSAISIPTLLPIEYSTLRANLFQTAAKITTLTTHAILLLIPALALMARIGSPWLKPLSAAVILAIPVLLVQQAAIEGTWWYLFTNMVMAGYCAFLYAHFALAVLHHPRFRPVTSGLLTLGGLPFVVGRVTGGIENNVAIRQESKGLKISLGWWVLGVICLLWAAVWGVLVVQVRDLLGLRTVL